MWTNVDGCGRLRTFRTALNVKITNNCNGLWAYFRGRVEPARPLLLERLYHPRHSRPRLRGDRLRRESRKPGEKMDSRFRGNDEVGVRE